MVQSKLHHATDVSVVMNMIFDQLALVCKIFDFIQSMDCENAHNWP